MASLTINALPEAPFGALVAGWEPAEALTEVNKEKITEFVNLVNYVKPLMRT